MFDAYAMFTTNVIYMKALLAAAYDSCYVVRGADFRFFSARSAGGDKMGDFARAA